MPPRRTQDGPKLAQDGCNVCACTPKGEWVCSETDCSPEQCLGPASCRPVIPPCSCTPICAPVGAEFPPGDCDIACPRIELPPLTCTCADGACVGRVGECRAGEVRFQEPCTECECSANGFWLCSGSSTCEEPPPPRVCRPGSAFAETNGQLCRCNNRGAWECECPREGGLPGCICHLGEWACDGDSEPTELPN